MNKLKQRIQRLEAKAGNCGGSVDLSNPVFMQAMANILGDLPEDFAEPPCIWKSPSQAGGLRPHQRGLPSSAHDRRTEGDHLQGYFGRFTPEQLDQLASVCRGVAEDVRAGRVDNFDALLERLPMPVLIAFERIFGFIAETAPDDERETSDDDEYQLRQAAAAVSAVWKTTDGPFLDDRHAFDG